MADLKKVMEEYKKEAIVYINTATVFLLKTSEDDIKVLKEEIRQLISARNYLKEGKWGTQGIEYVSNLLLSARNGIYSTIKVIKESNKNLTENQEKRIWKMQQAIKEASLGLNTVLKLGRVFHQLIKAA